MRAFLFAFMIIVNPFFIFAQPIKIVWLKQLSIPPRKNCRVPLFSPDGRYLSFEIHDNENAYLYLYEIASDRYIQLGKKTPETEQSIFGTIARRGTEFTGHLAWWYDKEGESLVFDFIHTPSFGKRYLYQSEIESNEDIRKFENKSFESELYERYNFPGNIHITTLRYPSFLHRSIESMPWIVFAGKQCLYLYNHGPNDPPIKITNPTGIWADLMGQFSPDDRKLVFIRDSRNNTDIGLIKFRRTSTKIKKISEELILNSSAIEVSPTWSPDGHWIAFFSDKDHPKNFSIWLYEVATGKTFPIVHNVEVTEDRRQGPTWVGNDGIIFVRKDLKKGYPIMYFDLQSRQEFPVPTRTINNISTTIHQLSRKEFLLAFTARGQEQTKEEQYIWTKLYLAKIVIE